MHVCLYVSYASPFHYGAPTFCSWIPTDLFLPALRNPGDETVSTTVTNKLGQKGDCLSIAKKLALLKEFEEVKNSGVLRPNKDTNSTYKRENARPQNRLLYKNIYMYISIQGMMWEFSPHPKIAGGY